MRLQARDNDSVTRGCCDEGWRTLSGTRVPLWATAACCAHRPVQFGAGSVTGVATRCFAWSFALRPTASSVVPIGIKVRPKRCVAATHKNLLADHAVRGKTSRPRLDYESAALTD